MENAYKLSDEHGFLDGKHGIVMKYELAEYFMKRAAGEGKKLSILKNMFAYDCPELVDETALTKVDGQLHHCTMADLGRKIQLSPTVINSWKTRGSIPRADIACKTAKALHTTVEYLIDGTIDTNNFDTAKTFLCIGNIYRSKG